MSACEFFMPMQPPTSTAQLRQVRVVAGKPQFYEPPAVRDARAKLIAHLAQHRPPAPLEGPLQVVLKWCFPRTGTHADGEYKATRSDVDNLAKLTLDVMTHLGFWNDDAQVASLVLEKFWASTPGIYVRVSPAGTPA